MSNKSPAGNRIFPRQTVQLVVRQPVEHKPRPLCSCACAPQISRNHKSSPLCGGLLFFLSFLCVFCVVHNFTRNSCGPGPLACSGSLVCCCGQLVWSFLWRARDLGTSNTVAESRLYFAGMPNIAKQHKVVCCFVQVFAVFGVFYWEVVVFQLGRMPLKCNTY